MAFDAPNVDVRLDNYGVYAFNGYLEVDRRAVAISGTTLIPESKP